MSERGSTSWGIRGRVGESDRSKEANGRVKKWKDISPGDVGSRVRSGVGFKEDASAELDGVIRKAGEAVPEKPPTTRRVGKRSIVGVAAKK